MFTSLNDDSSRQLTSNESIVIVTSLETLPGGKSLNVTGYTPPVIYAGHILITEDATGDWKPMPVNGANTAYAALPAGHTYAGVLNKDILTKKAMAGILVRGSVNYKAAPFQTAVILDAVKAALPHIRFVKD